MKASPCRPASFEPCCACSNVTGGTQPLASPLSTLAAVPVSRCGTAAQPVRTPTGGRAGTAECASCWVRSGGRARRRGRRRREQRMADVWLLRCFMAAPTSCFACGVVCYLLGQCATQFNVVPGWLLHCETFDAGQRNWPHVTESLTCACGAPKLHCGIHHNWQGGASMCCKWAGSQASEKLAVQRCVPVR